MDSMSVLSFKMQLARAISDSSTLSGRAASHSSSSVPGPNPSPDRDRTPGANNPRDDDDDDDRDRQVEYAGYGDGNEDKEAKDDVVAVNEEIEAEEDKELYEIRNEIRMENGWLEKIDEKLLENLRKTKDVNERLKLRVEHANAKLAAVAKHDAISKEFYAIIKEKEEALLKKYIEDSKLSEEEKNEEEEKRNKKGVDERTKGSKAPTIRRRCGEIGRTEEEI